MLIWCSYDAHLMLIWCSFDAHLMLIWCLFDPHLIIMWSLCDPHFIPFWSSFDPNMILVWSSFDPHLILFDPHMILFDPHLILIWFSFYHQNHPFNEWFMRRGVIKTIPQTQLYLWIAHTLTCALTYHEESDIIRAPFLDGTNMHTCPVSAFFKNQDFSKIWFRNN
jgi:hypothetical protein